MANTSEEDYAMFMAERRVLEIQDKLAVTALSGSTVTEVNGPTCRHAGAL